MNRLLILAFVLLVVAAVCVETARADHNGPALPGLPTTLIKNLWQDGEVTWCADSRATAYPGFITQTYQALDVAYAKDGVPHRQVAFGAGCEVMLTMPDSFPCGAGAAGCIYYNAWPVVVAMQYRLGYSDWRTTIAHEGVNGGHAMGLHEQYYDIPFVCKSAADLVRLGPGLTVMSCGTGIWQLTDWDRDNIWSWLLPKPLVGSGVGRHPDGNAFVFYCGADTAKVDRIALLKRDFVFGYYWTGESWTGNDVSAGCRGKLVAGNPGDCFYANQEISAWDESWQRGDMRNDRLLGCF
jgi:hypothetical protein